MFLLVILNVKRVTKILIHTYSLYTLVPSYDTQDQLLGLVSLLLCYFQIIAPSFLYGKKKKPCIFLRWTPKITILFVTVLSHTHSLTYLSTLVTLGSSQVILVSGWRIPERFGHLVLCRHDQFHLLHFISITCSVSVFWSSHLSSIITNSNTILVITIPKPSSLLQVFIILSTWSPAPLPNSHIQAD